MKLRSTDIFRLPWNTLIEDATGAGRPCRMIFTRDGLKTYPCELPRELRRIIFRRMLRAVAAPALIATGLYIAAVVAILYSGDFSGPNELVMPVPLSVVVAVFLTIGSAPTRMAYRRAHVDFFTQARRCSWCLYDLAGVLEDGEGLPRRPECGGVWRLPATAAASGAPHPPPTRAG